MNQQFILSIVNYYSSLLLYSVSLFFSLFSLCMLLILSCSQLFMLCFYIASSLYFFMVSELLFLQKYIYVIIDLKIKIQAQYGVKSEQLKPFKIQKVCNLKFKSKCECKDFDNAMKNFGSKKLEINFIDVKSQVLKIESLIPSRVQA